MIFVYISSRRAPSSLARTTTTIEDVDVLFLQRAGGVRQPRRQEEGDFVRPPEREGALSF